MEDQQHHQIWQKKSTGDNKELEVRKEMRQECVISVPLQSTTGNNDLEPDSHRKLEFKQQI